MRDSSNNNARSIKPSKLLLILLFNVAFFAALLYGFEIYLRASDPRNDLPKNGMIEDELDSTKVNEYTWGHLVKYNRFNFRERDFKTPKPAGVYRIMVVGDSFTFGTGLPVSKRYTNLLEERLNNDTTGKRYRFEVLNFGYEGVPTVYERDIILGGIDKMEPDLIIVGLTVNDPCIRGEENTVEKKEFDRRWRPLIKKTRWLAASLGLRRIGESFETAIYRIAEKTGVIPIWQVAIERSYDKSLPQWAQFTGALLDIKRASDGAGLARPILAVLTQPVYIDRPTDYTRPDKEISRYISWYDRAQSAANEAGFKTINFKEEFIERFSNEYVGINILDRHPSAKLNRVYSDKLFELIKSDYLREKTN